MRYASLLHDFGKVGVREHVLVKADKLYPHELDVLRARFELARKDRAAAELRSGAWRPSARGQAARRRSSAEETERLRAELKELDEALRVHPRLQPAHRARRRAASSGCTSWARLSFQRRARRPSSRCCSPREVQRALASPAARSRPRSGGRSRATSRHTFRFLSQIPWTRALRGVPDIAYAHHEKLDGKGYPRAIPAETHPGAVEDDGHLRHLRRAHRLRPALQEGRAAPAGARHPPPGGEERACSTPSCSSIFVEAEIPRRALPPPGF